MAFVVLVSVAASAPAQSNQPEVAQRLAELKSFLDGSPHAAGWSEYLLLDPLSEQLASPEPDVAVVAQSLSRLRSNQPGLELKPMADLRRALARWVAQSEAYQQQLPQLVRNAPFVVPAPEELQQRRQRLQDNLAQLEQFLRGTSNGPGWRAFLGTQRLHAELGRGDSPDLTVLDEVHSKLNSGHRGLELQPFRRVARDLGHYTAGLRATQTPDIQQAFADHMAELSTALEQQGGGDWKDLSPVADSVAWLLNHELGLDAVRAVTARFAFKNLFVTVSEEVIESGYAQRQRDVQTICETVEGTQVSGTATTDGDLSVRLVPSETQAMWDTLFLGHTVSQTLGRNRTARIGLSGQTELVGTKRIVLDAAGPRGLPATASASTNLVTTGIGSSVGGVRGRITKRVASKRVAESLPRAEQSTSQRAERELRNRLEQRAGAQIADAHRQFWERFRQPLAAKGLFPEDLLFSTTRDYLSASGTFTGPSRLAAPSLPPAWSEVTDLGVIVHETAINGMAQSFLAGETFHSENVRDEMGDLLGNVPDRFAQDEEGEPWSITFADRDPITVQLRDGQMSITVRGQRYTSGDRGYRAMNVTANYRFEPRGNGLEAVRQGELEIFPPGFVPGERRLSVAEQTLRRMLERRMGKIFAEELGISEMTLPRNFAKAGPMVATQLNSAGGWLTAGWRQKAELAAAQTAMNP
jgi:hypothetical protein